MNLLILAGPTGAGKSRLISEFVADHAGRVYVVDAAADPAARFDPSHPSTTAAVLDHALETPGGGDLVEAALRWVKSDPDRTLVMAVREHRELRAYPVPAEARVLRVLPTRTSAQRLLRELALLLKAPPQASVPLPASTPITLFTAPTAPSKYEGL